MSTFLRILICAGFVCVALSSLQAREDRQIRWKPVKGAYGYVIQYRSLPDGDTEELRVKAARADLRLPAGRYELRVAALNKFRKPALWTPWTPVRLDSVSAVVDLASRADPEESSVKEEPVAEPESPDEPDTSVNEDAATADPAGLDPDAGNVSPPGLSGLIPGVPQAARGQPLLGSAYWAGFAGIGAVGFSEWRAAETLSASLANDPTLLALLILPNPLELGFVLRERRLGDEARFNRHRQNQRAAGGAAALLYLVHLLDWYLFTPNPAAPAEPWQPEALPSVNFDAASDLEYAGGTNVLRGSDVRLGIELRLRF